MEKASGVVDAGRTNSGRQDKIGGAQLKGKGAHPTVCETVRCCRPACGAGATAIYDIYIIHSTTASAVDTSTKMSKYIYIYEVSALKQSPRRPFRGFHTII